MAEEQKPQVVPATGDKETVDMLVDGIGQIHLINGMIKMDLVTISPNGTDTPNIYIQKRLCMSLQQFLASKEVQDQMVNQLVEKGIISKQE